jgi:hypothetical protein
MLSLTSGIPEDTTNPLVAEFNRPWEEQQAKEAMEMDAWRRENTARLDRAIFEPDKEFEGIDLSFDRSPDRARKSLVVDSWLEINSDQPVGKGLSRALLRDRIADERFQGRGRGDDMAFYGEIEKDATQRKQTLDLAHEMQASATAGALLRETSDAGLDSQSFQLWRQEAKGKPGYQPGMDFAYMEAWRDTQTALRRNVEPYLGPLKQVWNSMQSGGADWYDAYDKVPEENREAFMASLAVMARALPAEQQPAFWSNLAKQARRDIQGQAVNVLEGIGGALDTGSPLNDYDPMGEQAAATADRSRKNFIADVERIRNETYDPVKVLNPDSAILRTLERGAYAAPGAIATSAAALVPFAGAAATYYHMEESAYRDMRRTLMDGGMSDADASDTAEGLAPLIAIPQAALERIGAGALVGKLPGLEKALAATANRITSTAGRYAARTGAIAGFETAIENTQDLIPALLQDAASALEQDVPGVVWKNGKDGFFDGYWEKTATTAVAILPLALIGGAGGLSAEGRAKAFAEAPDLHLRVLGISQDGIARIRAAQAQGRYQAEQTIEAELAARDPRSEDAMEATQELAETLQAEKDAVAAASDNGIMPRAVRGTDGTWTLYDTATGSEIGQAPDWQRAAQLATTHANFSADQDADRIATVFTAYQAAEVSGQWGTDTDRPTEIDLDLGRTLTAEQAAAQSASARERVAAQERLMGGDGSVTNIVLGQSRTELAQGQLRTVNRILEGGSVLDVFHEETHGFRRQAHARGTLTREDDVAFVNAVNQVLQGRTTREGKPLQLLPADFDTLSESDQETALDEAISAIAEAEVVRTRKGGGQRQLPAGIVSQNLSALARLLGDQRLGKFRSFIAAIREYFGLAIDRAAQIKRGLADGTLDAATYDGYLAKLLGVDEQIDYDQQARDAEAAILNGAQPAPLEGDPFSLGRRRGMSPFDSVAADDLQPVANKQEAEALFADGRQLFAVSEMDEQPEPITSLEMLAGYPSDSIYVANLAAPSFSIAPSRLRIKPPKGVTAIRTDSLPVWDIEQDKATSLPKVLNTPAARAKFFARLDEALEYLRADPARITTGPGWVKFLRMAGIYGKVPMPPSGLAEIINDPAAYVAKLNGEYHGERTIDSTQESARQGLDGTREMREIIGEGQAPAPWAVALHHLWGVLSRMLPPLQQEGMWLRLIAHRPVLDAIQSSIDGTFDMGLADWEQVVSAAREESAQDAGQVGNSATANANSFFLMLRNLNGRWQDAADVYAAPTSREMGRRFWALDAGALGIKNKVQRFIGLTFGVPGVIMDRWKFVEFWLPTAMEGTGAETTSDFFRYGQNTPSDPTGIYGVYGQVDSDNPVLSLAMYEAFEVVLQEAINKSPELKAHLGDHANPGGMHWHGWNAIKNEAVGHSSLDLTKDLQRAFGVAITAEDVHNTLRNGSYFTEGAETQQSNLKVTLERGKIRLERTGMAGGLQPGPAGILGQGAGRSAGRSGQQAAEVAPSFSLGSRRLGVLAQDSIRRIQNPLRRAQAMERVSRKLEDLRLEAERLELLSGTKRLKRALTREAAVRQALRGAELENEAWARHGAILSDDDLTKLRAQPVHSFFADSSSSLRGRLMSKTAAIKKHPDLFTLHNPGDYDGSEGVSRTVFGGDLAPDQAAQEAFDAGLLREPTTDALWQALESEARHVASMKKVLEAAKADLREARTVAKAETNAWLATQVDTQATTYSPRQEILRSLAALDAILSSVPAEIRGKVGGWVQAARIADPDAGLQFLRERLAKTDQELEKWLKGQYHLEFLNLLARATPERNEAGQRPRGKIGADVHSLFADLREAMTLTAAETEAEATRLEILAEQEDLTPDQQAHAMLQANLVRLVGDWSKASAARREAAVLEATRVFESGYMEEKIRMSRQREDRGKKRANLSAATGKAGTREERRTRAQRDEGTRTGRVLKAGLSLMSFEQVVQKAFGEGTPDAEALVDWERRAAHAKADALQHKLDLLDDLFASLAGGKLQGEQLRFQMSDAKGITATDAKGRTHTFSQLEAITATLMWRQEDGRRHMEGHVDDQGAPAGEWNYTQDFVDQLEDQLTDNAKAIRLHLAAQYGAEYERLNSVFRQLYGVSLPRHAHYSPLTVKPAQAGAGQTLDPVTGSTMTGAGLTPGSLKTRSQTAIAEPDFRDALQTYIAHSKQMEHFIAYSPFATEAMALINARNVGNSVEAAAGKETLQTLRGWLDVFAQGGTRDAAAHLAANQLMGRMVGRAAAVALVGRVSVLAIQSTQLAAALAEMPAAAYMVRLAKLFAGRLDWSAALRSDYIQRRKATMPPVVQQALDGLSSTKPSRLKYLARRMGETISGADALFTAGTYAITFDYHLKQARAIGVADPHAYARQAAERSTDRVAQPVRPGTRSLYEVTGTNPAVRIVWSFASDARQKLMLSAYALGSGKTPAAKARALAVTWLAGGLLASVIRATTRDLRDDDDDETFDEKNWDPKRLALASLTGPFGGIPFLGDALESTAFKLAGEYLPDGNLFSNIPKAITRLADLLQGDGPADLEEAAKDAETILSGAGLFSDSAAAAASISHLLRDLLAIVENATGTD